MSSDTWPQAEDPDPLPKRRGMLTLVFVVVVAGGLLVSTLAKGGTPDVATKGSLAPEFAVTLFDGSPFDLANHIAEDQRPIVLNLWASWCAPCRAEIPGLSTWAIQHPDVLVLGMAVEDNEPDARALADELKPSYPLGLGDEDFRSAYPSLGLPATYFIDGRGRVIDVVFGVVTAETLDDALGVTSG